MAPKLALDAERLGAFCQQNRIKKLALFGSVLRDDFGPDSDVDILVEFEEGARVGFFGLAEMEMALSGILGRKVDLRTPAELSRYFRQEVLDGAVVQYATGSMAPTIAPGGLDGYYFH